MNLKNQKVIHKTFGNGIIVEQNADYITIQFQDLQKKFVFPDVFASFLKCEDIALQSELEAAYAKRKNWPNKRLWRGVRRRERRQRKQD